MRDGLSGRLLLWTALAAGCAHGSAGRAGSAGSEDLGRTCAIDLGGSWQLESDVGYRYEVTDDGRNVRLEPHRVNADGTSLAQDATAETVHIELHRGMGHIAGDFRMPEAIGPDKSCPLLLHAELTSCTADRMVLEIAQNYALNQSCLPIDFGPIASDSHVLVRTKK